uniref:Putative secreted protein n=1 Tax=Anopheles darlingi TaxID=43151 RepID=A0A2M4DNQ3_ANODA
MVVAGVVLVVLASGGQEKREESIIASCRVECLVYDLFLLETFSYLYPFPLIIICWDEGMVGTGVRDAPPASAAGPSVVLVDSLANVNRSGFIFEEPGQGSSSSNSSSSSCL